MFATQQGAASPAAPTSVREQVAKNPVDPSALLALALQLEAEGKQAEATAAVQQALRLAPWSSKTLMQASAYFLRTGNEAHALPTLRRVIDVSRGEINSSLWQMLVTALDTEAHRDFFIATARENPTWWLTFFGQACERGKNVSGIQAVFAARAQAGVATADERRLIIERMERDGRWADARQIWFDSLPADQRRRATLLFNGSFEFPLSNLGFDWLVPAQEGVEVTRQAIDGMTGQRALNVTFVNKRYSEPPLFQYLMLQPGAYRFEGQGRTDLESWLGLQWGIYCGQGAAERELRQLTRTDRFIGSMDWRDFRHDFVVPGDCPVQVLRLELANPRRDATTPGAAIVRLKGRVWFDALDVQPLG